MLRSLVPLVTLATSLSWTSALLAQSAGPPPSGSGLTFDLPPPAAPSATPPAPAPSSTTPIPSAAPPLPSASSASPPAAPPTGAEPRRRRSSYDTATPSSGSDATPPRRTRSTNPYANLYGPRDDSSATRDAARNDRDAPPRRRSIVGAGAYPAVRGGYTAASVSSSTTPAGYEADGASLEPHVDGILTFWDRLGVGATAGYIVPMAAGQKGLVLGGELMVGLTSTLILRGLGGYVLPNKVHYGLAGVDTFEASAARFGGGFFWVALRTPSADLAFGFEMMHLSGAEGTTASGERLTYSGTGGFIDIALTLSP